MRGGTVHGRCYVVVVGGREQGLVAGRTGVRHGTPAPTLRDDPQSGEVRERVQSPLYEICLPLTSPQCARIVASGPVGDWGLPGLRLPVPGYLPATGNPGGSRVGWRPLRLEGSTCNAETEAVVPAFVPGEIYE